MNTKGIKVFEAIGRLPEDLVMEAQRYSVNYEENPEEKRSRRPAWLTGGVIAAAVCVLVGIATYVGILTFMSGGFDHLAALFGKDDTTAETTIDDSTSQDAEDITSDYTEETTEQGGGDETTDFETTINQTTVEDTTDPIIESMGLGFSSLGIGICQVSNIGWCTDTSIVIPSVSPSGDAVIAIGPCAFYECDFVTSITSPDSVTTIAGGAFTYCSNLVSINIPDGVTCIESDTFSYCSKLTSLKIPDGVTEIKDFAFEGCSLLSDINIPDSVESIGRSVFRGCSELIRNENDLSYVGKWVVGYYGDPTDVTICSDTVGIGDYTFFRCASIESIEIPNGIKKIGKGLFGFCTNLKSVTIPGSVTSIGEVAFNNCSSLNEIIYNDDVESWSKISKDRYWSAYTINYVIRCIDEDILFQLPKFTEDELNACSELILNPKSGKTLYVDFGFEFLGDGTFWGMKKYDETDLFIGWITKNDLGETFEQPIPVMVDFEPGILKELPDGIVVLAENGVEFIDGRVIYHAVDIIYDICVYADKMENGIVYGEMMDYLISNKKIPVKFTLPETYDILPGYSGSTTAPDELTISSYHFFINDVSLMSLKDCSYDGDTLGLLTPEKLECLKIVYR